MLLPATSSADDTKEITIGTEGAFPPWNFMDSAGNLQGFEIDLGGVLCARMQTECRFVPQAWDGLIPALQTGKIDAIMAGMSINDARRKVISFSRAYATSPAQFVVHRSSKDADLKTAADRVSLPDLDPDEAETMAALHKAFDGCVLGVQTATTHETFLSQEFGDSAEIRAYDTQENLDLDLRAGRIDAALASISYWKPMLESESGKDLVVVGPSIAGGPFGEGVGVGVRKDDDTLAQSMSAAIDASIAAGEIKDLSMKWFGFDVSVK